MRAELAADGPGPGHGTLLAGRHQLGESIVANEAADATRSSPAARAVCSRNCRLLLDHRAGLPRAQGRAWPGPLRRPLLAGLAPSRDLGVGRPRVPDPGAAAPPQTGGVGLSLWQLLEELQVLLGCWAGACPVCHRPAPRWLRHQGQARAPT